MRIAEFPEIYRNKLAYAAAIILLFAVITPHFSCTQPSARASLPVRKMQFSYAFTIKNLAAGANRVDIWAPVPRSDARQDISNLEIKCSYPYTIETEPEYGNSILKVNATGTLPAELSVAMNFQVTRSGYQVFEQNGKKFEAPSPQTLQRFLRADRLVPIDGKIAAEAKQVVRDDMPVLEKARAIYNHVAGTLTYDKSGDGWGRGDAIYACDIRRGNCTDFHSLFIGMARASAIPARFVIGFPVPEDKTHGDIAGYHCWAEFYVEGRGWVPVDASEANKHRDKWDFFFGGLDPNRVQFTVGRDLRLVSSADAEPLNYFIYPHVRVNGKPHEEVERHITFSETAD